MCFSYAGSAAPKHPWWRDPRFPLVPVGGYRPADESNTSTAWAKWLCLCWGWEDGLDLRFEVGLYTGYSARFQVTVSLPYTRLALHIPLPLRWMRVFDRKPLPRQAA